jgi:hypothetical protein
LPCPAFYTAAKLNPRIVISIDWSADGKSLLVSWLNDDSESALLRVALDGRASVLLRSRNDIWAVPSPDGRLLAIGEVTLTKNVGR